MEEINETITKFQRENKKYTNEKEQQLAQLKTKNAEMRRKKEEREKVLLDSRNKL